MRRNLPRRQTPRAFAIWRDEKPASGDGSGHPSKKESIDDSTPNGGGDGGADGAARDAVSSRQLTEHAQTRIREVTQATLGRARKAGLEIKRDASLQDLIDLVVSQKARLEELQETAESGGGGQSQSKGKGSPPEGHMSVADHKRKLDEALARQAKTYDEKLETETTSRTKAETSLRDHVVYRDLRAEAKAQGLDADGLVDYLANPLNNPGVRFEVGEDPKDGLAVIDPTDGSIMINPGTRKPYTASEKLGEIREDPKLARLVVGKIAGGPGGGSGKATADGASGGPVDTGKRTDSKKGWKVGDESAIDLIEKGINAGELGNKHNPGSM